MITFDPAKREWTLRERGVDFADAVHVFGGQTVTKEDDRIDYGEVRYITAGFLDDRMVIVVWTQREAARHIISMRFCHAREEKRWRENFR